MAQEWLGWSAAALGRAIDEGAIDPRELTREFLDAATAHPLRDRIYVRLTPDRALAEAEAAADRAARGQRLSPLDGVPISWKDLFDTAGTPTEAGSALLRGRVPDRDATVLRNATAAGLVCLGKTHMSELAFSGLGYNPVTATPPSVTNAHAVAGGSSSGAAASVAFGLAAAAVGSDTGGSVRIPAAWNDLVGLKTTHGSLPMDGVVPLCPSFDTVGPLARSVEDAALMLSALAGARAPDLHGATLEGAHFLLLETVALDDLDGPPSAGFKSAVDRLQAAGALVTRRAVPAIEQAMPLSGILFTSEAYGVWKERIEVAPDKMFPEILARFRSGRTHLAADYVDAWRRLQQLRQDWHRATAPFDGVLTPTAPILPPDLARLETDKDYYVRQKLLALRNTRIGNLMGLPALTLPTGLPACGIQILGKPGREAQLVRLGQAAESALA